MPAGWHERWTTVHARAEFIDLIDSRFHQNGLRPDPGVFEAAFARWLATRAYEPDSRGALPARQAVQHFYQGLGWSLTTDDVFLTAGTSEAYALLFATLADAGDVVALPRPGYPLFEQLAAHARLETVFYDQDWRSGWQPNAASVDAALGERTRFLVVISPNNPTGQVLSAASLAMLAERCQARGVTLIVDEVFDACFAGPGPLARPGALFPGLRVATLNGISKRFGSPDLKLAWIALSGPEAWRHDVGQRLELANDTFLSANTFSQTLLPDLFATFDPWQARVRAQLDENRRAVSAWMANEPRVQGLLPAGGIHGLWRFDGLPPSWDDERWAVELLDRWSLGVHPGYFYDVQEPGVWLVYSLLKDPVLFREGLARLADALSSTPRGSGARR